MFTLGCYFGIKISWNKWILIDLSQHSVWKCFGADIVENAQFFHILFNYHRNSLYNTEFL